MEKLLTKYLTNVEDIRQTLKAHTTLLKQIMRNQQTVAKSGDVDQNMVELPGEVQFPLSSMDDVRKMEELITEPMKKMYSRLKLFFDWKLN